MIKVGISCRMSDETTYSELRNSLALDWISFCERIQILPVLIPNGLTDIDRYCDSLGLDAIILSGGNNISPKLYQSEEELEDVYDLRDKTEYDIINYSIKNSLPLLGVCRGMFAINAFFKGSLTHFVAEHVATNHPVKFIENTPFFSETKIVNSFHNHAIYPSNLAEELVAFAYCDDGSIEAYKHHEKLIYGMLWHPERDVNDLETQRFIRTILNKGK